MDPTDYTNQSVFFEQLVEHVFVSEILQEAIYRHDMTMEVLHGEIDASGYDIVFECNGVVRHVQLKTSLETSKTSRQKVHLALAKKPSGCVVWIRRSEDRETARLTLRYLFFGGEAGEPLPSLDDFPVAKHTKANAQGVKADRPSIRTVPKGRFEGISTTRELFCRLFGLDSG